MKQFLTIFFLSCIFNLSAQVVNIPDPYFKYILLSDTNINTNRDNEIQESEAIAANSIQVNCIFHTDASGQGEAHYFGPVDITGIKSFTNLERLEIGLGCEDGGGIKRIDLDGMTQLRYLSISDSATRYISCKNCTALDSLLIDSPEPKPIDSVDCSGCSSLTYYLSGFNAPVLNCILTGCTYLKTFRFYNGNIPTPLNQFTNLETLELLYINSPLYLNLSNLTKLRSVIVEDIGNFSGINVSGCSLLESFYVRELYSEDTIPELDFSTCYNLKELKIYHSNQPVPVLNLKNGSRLNSFSIGTSLQVQHVCADEFEIENIHSYFASNGSMVNVNSFCSFAPGGDANIIDGTARINLIHNGCDSTNSKLKNLMVKVADTTGLSFITTTNDSGFYSISTGKGSFNITPYFSNPYFSVEPASATVHFDTTNHLHFTRDFCVKSTDIHNDLEITFLPTFPPARPGFDAAYTLVYKNRGTTTLSGNVAVNFDNNKMNFVSASENVSTQSSGQLLWNYNNLQPFESRTINVTFNLLPPPVNNIGDTISYLAVITPSDNDETAFDNIFILPQRVIGSFDPNDKQCIEGSKLDISKIGDYLHYQIRFQNEGTDTAFNVVVADTLSDKLDWNSFEFIGSSHAADVKLSNNKLEFFYPNINLPYKAIDEPGSNGWVAFKIKPKPSVVIGDSLNNRAAIYFDFNLPVITNTATTIVSSSSAPVPVKLEYFSVNKKDNTNLLNWKASCSYGNASFVIERSDDGIHFISIGNINATAVRCQLPFNFTDNNPVSGKNYYRLKITDAEGKSYYSKTLVTGNNTAGVNITAIANGIVYLTSNKQQTVIMKVIAADGREVLNQKQTVVSGNNNIGLQIKNSAKGIYALVIYIQEGETITKRFIK